jgi:hypothetical protein
MVIAPTNGDVILADYQLAGAATGNADTLDGQHGSYYTPISYLDTDSSMAANSDTKIPSQKAVKTYTDLGKSTAEGSLLNGKISVSVASNNLTLSLKTLAGADATASTPIYCVIGGVIRSVTAALSVTKNAGTNWCNSGSAEQATKEIDYFVYLGYNATDGVTLGFSRIPFACQYSDFSVTTTSEKYCAISIITNAAATDYYNVIGRFAATLSAGAGYTWSVPTFTAANLIQRPIFESRWLEYIPTYYAAGGTVPTYTTNTSRYKISYREVHLMISSQNSSGGTAGAGAVDLTYSLPISASNINSGFPTGSALYYNGNQQNFMISQVRLALQGGFIKINTVPMQAVDQNNSIRFIYNDITYEA